MGGDSSNYLWRLRHNTAISNPIRFPRRVLLCDGAEPLRGLVIKAAADLGNRQSRMEPHGVMSGRLFCIRLAERAR